MAGGLVGAWIGARLCVDPLPRQQALRTAAVVGAAGIALIAVFALYKPADEGVRAEVALTEVEGGAERTVDADVKLSPPDAADDAEWLNVTAWQGDGLQVAPLERVGEGRYRTTEPVPVHGNWKALIRLHNGNSLTAAPIFMPEDPAIPAKEVAASRSFTRPFVADQEILQREQKPAAPALTVIAYGVVARSRCRCSRCSRGACTGWAPRGAGGGGHRVPRLAPSLGPGGRRRPPDRARCYSSSSPREWPGFRALRQAASSRPEAFGPGGGGSESGPCTDCQRIRSRIRCGVRSVNSSGRLGESVAFGDGWRCCARAGSRSGVIAVVGLGVVRVRRRTRRTSAPRARRRG